MFIHFKHIVCILLSGAMLLGLPCCTCKSVQDARQTISMADSMRVNEGRLYDVKQCLGWHCEWCARNVPTLRSKRAT